MSDANMHYWNKAISWEIAAGKMQFSPGNSIADLVSLDFNASSSNSLYGNSSTVQPSSLNLNVLIKY